MTPVAVTPPRRAIPASVRPSGARWTLDRTTRHRLWLAGWTLLVAGSLLQLAVRRARLVRVVGDALRSDVAYVAGALELARAKAGTPGYPRVAVEALLVAPDDVALHLAYSPDQQTVTITATDRAFGEVCVQSVGAQSAVLVCDRRR